MATDRLRNALAGLQATLAPAEGDGPLLARFLAGRDEAAFSALVRRHGPMVLGVCRRLLSHEHDAEDAFQATFLVLARKAGSLRKREALGPWLYAVACRTAHKLRSVRARRWARERQVQAMPHPSVGPPEAQDWRPLLDAELSRLPERYRAPVVLCDLQGQSYREAACRLGLANTTLARRLAAGRKRLAERLARRGVALSGGALAALLSEGVASAAVPASLVAATAKAAAGPLAAVSVPVAFLTRGVLRAMLLTKIKLVAGVVLLLAALGAGGVAYHTQGARAAQADKQADGKPRSELEALRRENALLKLNLEVVLEKVRTQAAELRTLRGQVKAAAAANGGDVFNVIVDTDGRVDLNVANSRPADLAHDAEAALKALREAKDDAARRRAVEALDRALGRLREQLRRGQPAQQGDPRIRKH
jgi:RNA polymerase sigma factor (sigma-70 family)